MSPGSSFDGMRFGQKAEEAAAAYLVERGLQILTRNWRCRIGEVDLVALEGSQVVFVEVKARRSGRQAHPAEAVGPRKQQRLLRLAALFLQSRGWSDRACRFDVVSLTLSATGQWQVEWIRDAFQG